MLVRMRRDAHGSFGMLRHAWGCLGGVLGCLGFIQHEVGYIFLVPPKGHQVYIDSPILKRNLIYTHQKQKYKALFHQ